MSSAEQVQRTPVSHETGVPVGFAITWKRDGTRLDDEWAAFLAEHGFLVGISLDGPRELHDGFLVDKVGHGTFDQVLRGLRLLQRHEVEYNVLATVNRLNGDHPLTVYRFLRDEVGTDWMQLIPVVEQLDDAGRPDPMHGTRASERSVLPEQWGSLLTEIWDEWVRNDVGSVFVQTFEAALRNYSGAAGSGLCVFDETCGYGLALEHNGDLYSCDHFVEPQHRLGNIRRLPMVDLLGSHQQRDFGAAKRDVLPRMCRECDVRFACHGECPKNRSLVTPDGEPGLNCLCAGFMRFFRQIERPAKAIVALLRSGHEASEVMTLVRREDEALAARVRAAGRNAPCPCGSGRKVKHCHGGSRSLGPADLTGIPLGTPRPPVISRPA